MKFKLSASIFAFLLTVFSPELFYVGPQVPSVAIYSTKDKQSECCPPVFKYLRCNFTDKSICRKTIFFHPAEVFDVETNERVNTTYNNMQMPKVENKTIVIDDYSMFSTPTPPPAHVESADTQLTCVSILMTLQPVTLYYEISSNLVPSVAALTMQILKPAGFIETAHYPLLLLVWVWIRLFSFGKRQNITVLQQLKLKFCTFLFGGRFTGRALKKHKSKRFWYANFDSLVWEIQNAGSSHFPWSPFLNQMASKDECCEHFTKYGMYDLSKPVTKTNVSDSSHRIVTLQYPCCESWSRRRPSSPSLD